MGNKTICCSNADHFGTSSKLSMQPKITVHASFAGCQVNLSRSQILNENSEAIVLVVNRKLKMGNSLEEQLKKQGGLSVINSLKQVRLSEGGKLELGQVVYTHAGDMEFDYIFYAVMASCCDATSQYGSSEDHEFLPTSSLKEGLRQQMDGLNIYTEKLSDSKQTHERQNIYECVLNCLQLATTLGIKSLAFPVLEPFNGNISKPKIASIMLFAIKQFLKENPKTTLTEIKISTQDTKIINLFKFIITNILVDNSETTIDGSALKNKMMKSSSIYSSEYDVEEQMEQIKVDDLMKFIHPYQEPINGNKIKSSF